MSPASLAPPSRVDAEESVKISTLWGTASLLVNSTVIGLPAGAARQFVSNAMFCAVTFTVVPSGWHAGAAGVVARLVGTAGVGWARAKLPDRGWATTRFALESSNQARA